MYLNARSSIGHWSCPDHRRVRSVPVDDTRLSGRIRYRERELGRYRLVRLKWIGYSVLILRSYAEVVRLIWLQTDHVIMRAPREAAELHPVLKGIQK